jgi:hypothetical protein
MRNSIFILLGWLITGLVQAQEVSSILKGRITDGETGEGLPFVFISVHKTPYGTQTDEEGYYTLKAQIKYGDSVAVNYIGYKRTLVSVAAISGTQTINIVLQPDEMMMQEIVVTVQENPAFPIMRKVMRHKDQNDPRKLTAFRYDNYSKVELSIDNLGPRMQKKKFMKAIQAELKKDSLSLEKGNDGNPVVPVIFSETLSKVYRNRDGARTKEEILAVKSNNLGFTNGKIVKPLLYSTYQESNFYLNRIRILETDFLSPIADSWQLLYDYELQDTVWISGDSCFQIAVKPKNPRDLAFTGTIWIADSSFALKQIEVKTDKKTTLNFVEGIKIYQLNEPTTNEAWFPVKTKIELDLSNITHWKLGVLARLTTYASNIVVDDPMSTRFFDEIVVEMEDAYDRAHEMELLRVDTLTQYEQNVTQAIHTISKVKPIRRYVALANILSTGFMKVGKVDLGHYFALYNRNNIEGVRTSLGFRTNPDFSRKIIFKGYGAYGFYDQVFKYSGGVDYILSRRPWTLIGIEHRYDMDQVGVNAERLANNEIFYAFTKNGTMKGPYYNTFNNIYFQTDLRRGLTQRVSLRMRDFNPAYSFEYYRERTPTDTLVANTFHTTELIFDTHWGKDEFRFINGNQRLSVGAKRWPIVTLRNMFGLKNFLNGQFEYYKVGLTLSHNFALGIFGRTYYNVYAGKVFGTVPYPLLETHIGNESYFYSTIAFNQMNYFEFISDTYASLKIRHYFGGLLFNRIPVIKRFKWGLFVTSNIIFGHLSDKNYSLIPERDMYGTALRTFYTLNNMPYIEVGYGIENIFKFLRVDFVHRITHLDNVDVRKFGVKFSFKLGL